ncbi:MAG: hypothetical protein IJW82_06760 [Clostridia bacterium]|nr:hypothetical protein [Clostridia bacterium]
MAHFPYLLTFLSIIFFVSGLSFNEKELQSPVLIIGAILLLAAIIKILLYYIGGRVVEFYDNNVIVKEGIINRSEKKICIPWNSWCRF